MSVSGGKNKATAAVFAILLGWLGIHKFYLGQTVAGVLYLLFFWTGFPLIISVIEGIVYLAMSDDDFNRKYNN